MKEKGNREGNLGNMNYVIVEAEPEDKLTRN